MRKSFMPFICSFFSVCVRRHTAEFVQIFYAFSYVKHFPFVRPSRGGGYTQAVIAFHMFIISRPCEPVARRSMCKAFMTFKCFTFFSVNARFLRSVSCVKQSGQVHTLSVSRQCEPVARRSMRKAFMIFHMFSASYIFKIKKSEGFLPSLFCICVIYNVSVFAVFFANRVHFFAFGIRAC